MRTTTLLVLFAAGFQACSVEPQRSEPPTAGITTMHVPKSGCPAGWKLEPDVFTYRGRPEPACLGPSYAAGRGATDYLRGGESMRVIAPISVKP